MSETKMRKDFLEQEHDSYSDITLRRWNPLMITQIAKFMGPTWGPSGSCRPQMGPMLAPWTLLSGKVINGLDIQTSHEYRFDGLVQENVTPVR